MTQGKRTAAGRPRRRYPEKKGAQGRDGLRPGERRQLLQLAACSGAFVLLVAAKLLLPDRLAPLGERLTQVMERNMDVQAVFSAVGRAFSGDASAADAAEEVYRAVFLPQEDGAVLTAAPVHTREGSEALELLRSYRPAESSGDAPEEETGEAEENGTESGAEETTGEAGGSVWYSQENLPEGVSMEQALLDFAYCTPVSGTLSSGFGYREHPLEGGERFHYGVDLAAASGTSICAFADGTVTAVGESTSYGKYCVLSHPGGYSTLYAHCSRVTAASGAAVAMGEKIAEVGQTGFATGPHLHFELQHDGVYLNPIYYVSRA